MANKLGNLATFLREIAALISQQFEFNFNSAPWPPLAAATIASKQAQGYPLDILVRTGAMKDAATSGAWRVSSELAELGVPGYSGFHFEGTSFMPARDYAYLPDSFGEQAGAILQEYLSV
jgi:hypothetical protein